MTSRAAMSPHMTAQMSNPPGHPVEESQRGINRENDV